MFNKFRNLARKLLSALPPKLAARIEYLTGRRVYFYPWGSAMNGQTARLEICRRCLTGMPIDAVMETGTYRGVTTEWFASFGHPVYSIEIDPKLHYFSKQRLANMRNVNLYLGDSKAVISEKLRNALNGKNVFAYLDAHWRDYLPLREEISDICSLATNFTILIDDFMVPSDVGYEYDDYGSNGACTLEFIKPSLTPEMAIYFPTTPAAHETGRKRGYVIIGCGKQTLEFLDTMDLLKRNN